MPIEFSKVWDTQNNCYVYTLKKNGDKGKVGMLKFFDRDGDGLDANDGFKAKNSSIFTEEELQKNVLSKYRDFQPNVTTTVDGKETNLPEVEYTEDETSIKIKDDKEYNLGSFAKVLKKDYSSNKTKNQSQYPNNQIYSSPYQNNYSSQNPNYTGLTNLALNSMNNTNTPNLNWMNMYPLESQSPFVQQPNVNYNNLAMFQNKWTNYFSAIMGMGTMGNAEMMGAQFQIGALAMMYDSNFLFGQNPMMQFGGNSMSYRVNNNPYGSYQQQYNSNNTMATSGALTDNNQNSTLSTSGALTDNQSVITNPVKVDDTKPDTKDEKTDETKDTKDADKTKKTVVHHHKKHTKKITTPAKNKKENASPKADDEKAESTSTVPTDLKANINLEKYVALPDKTRVANPYKLKAEIISKQLKLSETNE